MSDDFHDNTLKLEIVSVKMGTYRPVMNKEIKAHVMPWQINYISMKESAVPLVKHGSLIP